MPDAQPLQADALGQAPSTIGGELSLVQVRARHICEHDHTSSMQLKILMSSDLRCTHMRQECESAPLREKQRLHVSGSSTPKQ